MVNLTTVDAAIVKKINASKAKFMTGPQLETALPTLAAKDIRASVQFMVVNQVLVTTTNRAGDVAFKVKTDPTGGGSAAKLDTRLLPVDQKFVYGAIQSAQGKGINLRNLKAVLAGKNITIPPMVMKKLLQGLEKQGFIKSFTAINAPTVPLYHGYQFEPDPTLIGGFFYNPQTKSLDTDLINRLTTVCLSMVRTRTLPLTAAHYDAMRSSSKSAPAPDSDDPPNYPLIPVMKRNPPSPAEILAFVRKHSIVPNCDLGAIMQVMRAIEMEGLVERIKPIGGVSPVEGISSDEDEPGPSKRRKMKKGDDSDSDDSGEERKAREKAKMKKKKEKERERAKEKEREKKRKEKEREKEKEKKRKEREKEKKAKRKKEKEREKKKRKRDLTKQDTPDSGDDSDALRAIDDSPDGKKSKSKSKSKSSSSKSKKSKRKRGASSDSSSGSDSDSGSDTASSSDTDSDSDSGSGSGSESDASSVNSEDIDNDDLALHRGGASGGADGEDDDGGPVGIKNLSDSHVAYRAVRPYSFGFGFGEMPCGKCPVFSFCQEGGPVNATECVYIEDWLTGNRGGWTNEAELREQKELKERTQRAEAEAREAAKAKKAERERLKKSGERVEEEGMVEDDDHDGMASGREDADEGWDD